MPTPSLLRSLPSALTLAFALAVSASAQTTTLLDDFSTDLFSTNYVQKNVSGFSSGGWNITSGRLMPDTTSTGGYAAYVWTSNALQNVGDSFTIDLSVGNFRYDHNGGLSVWTSNTSTFDRIFEPRLSGNGSNYAFASTDANGIDHVDAFNVSTLSLVQLTVALTGRGASGNDSDLTATLSFVLNGSHGSYSQDYHLADFTGPLYVGPSDWQGSGPDVSFDNLSYTAAATSAVPEPSTYAAFAGAAILAFAFWRRRRNAAPAASTGGAS